MRLLPRSSIVFGLLLLAVVRPLFCPEAGLAKDVDAFESNAEQLTNGEHSYATLGPDFYTMSPPMSPAPGARLVLLDWDTVRLLGLNGDDLDLVERTINKKFALTTTTTPTAKSYLATNYNDNMNKGPGHGDGRAFLAGEVSIPLSDGRVIRLDVMIKGSGRTKPGWRDGLLSLREAVHDFLTSKRNVRQQLDSTIDLGVIALGGQKYVEGEKDPVPTGLLIRVGQQMRPAHLGGQGDSPENSRKMLEYLVRKNLGLAMDHPVGVDEIKKYVIGFVTNLAEEGARADDLGFSHGMMHPSNLTTSGGSIDFGTSRQMDGYHAPFNRYQSYVDILMEYIGFTRPGNHPTRSQLKLKVGTPISSAIHEANMRDPVVSDLMKNELSYEKMNALYSDTYEEILSKLWLTRLGLTPEQIARMPDETRTNFYRAALTLVDKRVERKAELDMHGAFSRSLAIISKLPEDTKLSAYDGLFDADRKWGNTQASYPKEIGNYIAATRQILNEMGDATEIEQATARAKGVLPRKRADYSVASTKDPFQSDEEKRLYRQVQDPKISLVQNSKLADQIVEDTIHHGLLPRQNESLTNMGSLLYGERGKKLREAVPVRTRPLEAAACLGRRLGAWLQSF